MTGGNTDHYATADLHYIDVRNIPMGDDAVWPLSGSAAGISNRLSFLTRSVAHHSPPMKQSGTFSRGGRKAASGLDAIKSPGG